MRNIINKKIMIGGVWHDDNSIKNAIRVNEEGKIYIDLIGKPIEKISIEFKAHFSDDYLVYGDSWERVYADAHWGKAYNRVMPWYCVFYDRDNIYGYGVKTLPNAFCFWEYFDNKLVLTADVRCGGEGVVLEDSLFVAELVCCQYKGDLFAATTEFCKAMCDNPLLPQRPIFGGNDWYCNYGNNSYQKIISHSERIAECAKGLPYKPYMVIDDGWQICHNHGGDGADYYNGGPWQYANKYFGNMAKMAEDMEKIGVIPGIWLRPLQTYEKLDKKCFLKFSNRILDPTVPESKEYIKKTIETICGWGFKMIKHDFSSFDLFGRYGNVMNKEITENGWSFSDRSKTSAQIVKEFYQLLRDAAKNCLMIGCNTFSHLSAGIFEIQRTGDDTSGKEWKRTKDYGINALAFRMPQHNNFYCADADCVGITVDVDWQKNKQWLDVLSKSGTALFISIAEDAYNDDVKKEITEAFKKCCTNTAPSIPLDWISSKTPEDWKSVFGTDTYKW